MKYFLEGMVEFFLMLLHFPMSIFNLFPEFEPVSQSKYKIPVVLVERWIKRNPLHIFIKWYLERKGFKVYSVNFLLLAGTFRESAEKLKSYIEKEELNDAILVGLSCGGLTCYQYLTDYKGWEKTKILITVGAPMGGGIMGKYLPFKKVREEVSPDGKYINLV